MLITDLDNTLYDWIIFFSKGSMAKANELSKLINVDRKILMDEFEAVHQYYKNIEQSFSILELKYVNRYFGNLPPKDLVKKFNIPLHAFNSVRKKYLHLCDNVEETLLILKKMVIL